MNVKLRILACFCLIAIALSSLVLFNENSANAQRSVEWLRYDVHLDVQTDGTIDVAGYQEIDFIGGTFSAGFATIPLDRIDSIQDVRISALENGAFTTYTFVNQSDYDSDPGTYTVIQTSSELVIDWGFPPVTNDARTFLLEYRVFGAIRNYPAADPPNQQIWWTAIGQEVTDIANVDVGTVSIQLPEAVNPADTIAGSEGVELAYTVEDDDSWTWTYDNMGSGDDLTVRLQFPPITQASAPAWQERDDQQRAGNEEADRRSALLNLIFLAIAGLAAIGGGIGLYGLWYTRGRDPHAPAAATFLAEPPDDLAPGAAGVLLDERADEKDLIATLLDLARRKVLTLDEEGKQGLFDSRDFKLTLGTAPEDLKPFEFELAKAIFGPTLEPGETTTFSQVKTRFAASSESIKNRLYNEVVSRGYFEVAPEATRRRWRSGSTSAIVAIGIGAAIVISRFASESPAIWLTIAVAIVLCLIVMWLSGHMPRKTLKGAEAASKWNAFKRYLDDIEKYEELSQRTDIFDRYLPFVTAFGIEDSWVSKFASVNAPSPEWYDPAGGGGFPGGTGMPRGGRGPVIIWGGSGGGGRSQGGGGGGGNVDLPNMPDLQDMSDTASRSLANSSDGLFDLLKTAGEVFAGFGSSSGGKRGGGFGGGGFGGGGFSGGGSSGGSSGGGSRGFR